MKRNLIISFLLFLAMFFVMRWQGSRLNTPMSPRGIIDLEFAKTQTRLSHLRLFWNEKDVRQNILLDFLFIVSYVWFLATASLAVKNKWSNAAVTLAVAAGTFDVCENFLMMLVLDGKFSPEVLQIVFYCAAIKFIFAGVVILYLLFSLVLLIIRGRSKTQTV